MELKRPSTFETFLLILILTLLFIYEIMIKYSSGRPYYNGQKTRKD